MKRIRLWILSCLGLLCLSSLAHAQAFIPVGADAGGGFSLQPMVGADGTLFHNGLSAPDSNSRGTVGGRASSSLGNVEIGFDYIRPYWTGRDFTLVVPAANVGNFPLLGNTGHVDDHFSVAPHVNYKYDVSDILAIKATGSFLSLTGQLQRNLSPADGSTGNLTANSSLTIVTANLPEISTRFHYDEFFSNSSHLYWSLLDDLTIDLGLGTRYSSVQQDYTGKLTNTIAGGASNETVRYSTQSFKGVGLTTSLNFSLPVHENWRIFTNTRASIMVGDNVKDSSLSVNLGAAGTTTTISQTKTEFVPVGEIEMGAEWIHEFADPNRPNVPGALFSVRVGMSASVWGNVGPLSAGSGQGYNTSNLYLVGAHIMVGLAR